NFLAALALLEPYHLSAVQIQSALDTFLSVKRRLQIRLENKAATIIEDFAHHPTAIEANLKVLRMLYPKRRLVVLIEPRSNTMVRRFFQEQLVDALSAADVIFSDDIYRKEKYAADDRLDLARLENDLKARGKKFYLLPKESRTPFVIEKLQEGDVVCFMTNGSFSGLIGDVVEKMGER
ncbi:MAG TPA: cyanophycin synthetase, partial [Turneriella sp.]|nr:cyanophycin synthetase [Turneriella sp.]